MTSLCSVPGANPDLVLLNGKDEVVERLDLSKLNQDECNKLLLQKGFYKKAKFDDPIPEEYLEGPYEPQDSVVVGEPVSQIKTEL